MARSTRSRTLPRLDIGAGHAGRCAAIRPSRRRTRRPSGARAWRLRCRRARRGCRRTRTGPRTRRPARLARRSAVTFSNTIAHTQTLASSSSSMTSFTTMSACRNRPRATGRRRRRRQIRGINRPVHSITPSSLHPACRRERLAPARPGCAPGRPSRWRTQASSIRQPPPAAARPRRKSWRSVDGGGPERARDSVTTSSSVVEPRGAQIVHFDAPHHEDQAMFRPAARHAGRPPSRSASVRARSAKPR